MRDRRVGAGSTTSIKFLAGADGQLILLDGNELYEKPYVIRVQRAGTCTPHLAVCIVCGPVSTAERSSQILKGGFGSVLCCNFLHGIFFFLAPDKESGSESAICLTLC